MTLTSQRVNETHPNKKQSDNVWTTYLRKVSGSIYPPRILDIASKTISLSHLDKAQSQIIRDWQLRKVIITRYLSYSLIASVFRLENL